MSTRTVSDISEGQEMQSHDIEFVPLAGSRLCAHCDCEMLRVEQCQCCQAIVCFDCLSDKIFDHARCQRA